MSSNLVNRAYLGDKSYYKQSIPCYIAPKALFCAMKPTLKDLRTTYRVLSKLNYDVPKPLLVALADLIKDEEKLRKNHKIARMSEEDLIRYQASPRRRLRINLPDRRIIQEKTNEETFYTALREVDFSLLLSLDLLNQGHPIFVGFDSPRRQYKDHKQLQPGQFVYRKIKSQDRMNLLRRIDESLHLNWEIIFC